MNKPADFKVEDLSEPLTYPVEAFLSREYAEAECEKLWPKVWRHAGRVDENPEGQEPKTEWVYAEPTGEKWGSVLAQDFGNMGAVQKGMKSRGFRGALPNPHQERKVTNFHRNLSRYMGAGFPHLLN